MATIQLLQLGRVLLIGAMLGCALYELWQRRREVAHLIVGLWALSVATFLASRIVMVEAATDSVPRGWADGASRLHIASALFCIALGTELGQSFTKAPVTQGQWLLRGLGTVVTLLPFAGDVMLTSTLVLRPNTLGGALLCTTPTAVAWLVLVVLLTAAVSVMRHVHRHREALPKRRRALIFGVLTLVPAAANDLGCFMGAYEGPFLVDFMLPVVVFACSLSLVRDQEDEAQALEELVEARTDELQHEQSKLVAEDRLASLGTLAAGIAHQINNPLTYVGANLDEMTQSLFESGDGLDVERARTLAQEAREGVDAVSEVVEGLRVFARTEHGSPHPVNVRDCVETAIKMTGNEIRHRAELVVDLRSSARVLADEGELTQVVVNLLVNAAHALPERGDELGRVELTLERVGDDGCRLVVEDDGCGIEPEAIERVFDPFFTARDRKGTGLGLSMCHGIITAMGGTIEVTSELGEGTRVVVVLPAAPRRSETRSRPAQFALPSGARKTERRRILIVDDDVLVAKALGRMLRRHDVERVHDGMAALERLRSASFDAIVCDVMMPGMSGDELYARVLEELPQVAPRFVFVTGGAFTPSTKAFVASCPTVCLRKPVDADSLRVAVKSVGDEAVGDGAVGDGADQRDAG